MNGKEYNQTFHYFDKRTNEEDMPLMLPHDVQDKYEQMDGLFEEFFDANSLSLAKQNSKDERDKKGLNDSSFVYGEITFRSVAYIFEYIKAVYGKDSISPSAFYDLGSGIGRGVVAAAFLFPFKKSVGIEYLEKLHLIGLDIKSKYEKTFEELIMSHQADFFPDHKFIPQLELCNDDFLKQSWTDASFVLANSTCFSADLMMALSKKADEELQPGTFFITFTKRLPNLGDNWDSRDGFRRLMSWGIATVYIHRKK